MTFGLAHGSHSLPEWQAVKLTFFAPWCFCVTKCYEGLETYMEQNKISGLRQLTFLVSAVTIIFFSQQQQHIIKRKS